MVRTMLKDNERLDDLQNGTYVIQRKDSFCFGVDAVLLAHFPVIKNSDRVLDMGTGCGVIPVIMSSINEKASFTGMEIQPEIADTARRSVEYNGLNDRIRIVEGDIKEAVTIFGAASFSLITCNPPYMPPANGKENENEAVAIARHEIKVNLEEIIARASKLLKFGGKLCMIHRPSRLMEMLELMRSYRLEPKRMQLVHPYAEKEATMVLVEAASGGKPYMRVEPPIIIYDKNGNYTQQVLDIYGKHI